MVAREEGGVDFDAGYGPRGDAEPNDGPVEGVGVVPARFPPVVPGAAVDEFGSVLDGWLGVNQICGVGEPFVGGGEDLAS